MTPFGVFVSQFDDRALRELRRFASEAEDTNAMAKIDAEMRERLLVKEAHDLWFLLRYASSCDKERKVRLAQMARQRYERRRAAEEQTHFMFGGKDVSPNTYTELGLEWLNQLAKIHPIPADNGTDAIWVI